MKEHRNPENHETVLKLSSVMKLASSSLNATDVASQIVYDRTYLLKQHRRETLKVSSRRSHTITKQFHVIAQAYRDFLAFLYLEHLRNRRNNEDFAGWLPKSHREAVSAWFTL